MICRKRWRRQAVPKAGRPQGRPGFSIGGWGLLPIPAQSKPFNVNLRHAQRNKISNNLPGPHRHGPAGGPVTQIDPKPINPRRTKKRRPIRHHRPPSNPKVSRTRFPSTRKPVVKNLKQRLQRLFTKSGPPIPKLSRPSNPQIPSKPGNSGLKSLIHQGTARRLLIIDDGQRSRIPLHGIKRHLKPQRREQPYTIRTESHHNRIRPKHLPTTLTINPHPPHHAALNIKPSHPRIEPKPHPIVLADRSQFPRKPSTVPSLVIRQIKSGQRRFTRPP